MKNARIVEHGHLPRREHVVNSVHRIADANHQIPIRGIKVIQLVRFHVRQVSDVCIEYEGVKVTVRMLTDDRPMLTNVATLVMKSPRNRHVFKQFEFLWLLLGHVSTNSKAIGEDIFPAARTVPVAVHKLIARNHFLIGKVGV